VAQESVKKLTPKFASKMFKFMRHGGSSQDALLISQACFKLASILVRDCPWHPISKNEVRVLLSFVEADVQDSDRQTTAFSVLKAILSRKLVAAELYDIMDKVMELMIRTHIHSLREHCQQVGMVFLLDYPLGRKRLEKTINFLVSNLDYEVDTGREAALTMLRMVAHKFPPEIIEEYADLFFASLVKLLVNTNAPRVRKAASAMMVTLLQSVTPSKQDSLHRMALAWSNAEAPSLKRAGVQVVCLFLDALEKGYARFVAATMGAVQGLVFALPDDSTALEYTDLPWELIYLTFTALEKLLRHFPDQLQMMTRPAFAAKGAKKLKKTASGDAAAAQREAEAKKIWSTVEAYLLHSHTWVRLAASRLVGCYFSSIEPQELVAKAEAHFLDQNTLYRIGKLVCRQIQGSYFDEDFGNQVVKIMFYILRVLYLIHTNPADDGAGAGAGAAAATTAEGGGEDGDQKKKHSSGLVWTFKQLAYHAKTEATVSPTQSYKRNCVFKIVAAVANFIKEKEQLMLFLPIFMEPLYRTDECEDSSEEIKGLGSQVLMLIKKIVGVNDFATALNTIRGKIAEVRMERKTARVQLAVTEPEKAAQFKMKKNLKKRDYRKRKIDRLRGEEGRSQKKTKPRPDAE